VLLKVGELAKRTGLTVRTLHHYDEIGLLAPSGRSEAGYRLYSREDVQRLHSIQALRQLGLPLQDITQMLAGTTGADPSLVIAQQLMALDQQIAQATELRGRLQLLRDSMADGGQPDMASWLETLALMGTYGKYFSAAELKRIFGSYKLIEAEFGPLTGKVRAAMERGVAPDALEIQPLVSRWMALMVHWMGGDFELMERWGHMFRAEPSAHGKLKAPKGDMIAYMDAAIDARVALLQRYIAPQQIRGIGFVSAAEWAALEHSVHELLQANAPVTSPQAQAAAAHWDGLMDKLTRNNATLRAQLLDAHAREPRLQAGAPLSAPVRDYLQQTIAHRRKSA
jgi:DNA-binding transcriptional MerR regulator